MHSFGLHKQYPALAIEYVRDRNIACGNIGIYYEIPRNHFNNNGIVEYNLYYDGSPLNQNCSIQTFLHIWSLQPLSKASDLASYTTYVVSVIYIHTRDFFF